MNDISQRLLFKMQRTRDVLWNVPKGSDDNLIIFPLSKIKNNFTITISPDTIEIDATLQALWKAYMK